MKQQKATVLRNAEVALNFHEMELLLPDPDFEALPGQFLTLQVGAGVSPLLRRPFALASSEKDESGTRIRILYQRRGTTTTLLSAFQPGERVDVLGALGNSFPMPAGRALVVGGGIGIGPLLFLRAEFEKRGIPCSLFIGARDAERIPLALLPPDTNYATDDGSLGFKGTIVDALKQRYSASELQSANLTTYACGPHVMMKAVAKWLPDSLPGYVSLEQTMACAVGACMGCVVPGTGHKKYVRVCADGPVFSIGEIEWNQE